MTTTTRVSRYFDIATDTAGHACMKVFLDGVALLRLPLTNKGTAFSYDERTALGLDGLLPPRVNSLAEQAERAYRAFQLAPTAIDKYQFLRALQERQEVLFYALLERHLAEMMPIVYTPTVGEAVRRFSHLYQNARGLSLSPLNIERAPELMTEYPLNDVRLIVATDSSAILGIGDQGYGGLAIPIGKLALYTAGAGLAPFHTMPVALDVGTDRADLLEDPLYLGVRHGRLTGERYLAFTDRFVAAVQTRWPRAVIQWEDLTRDTAFAVLERYRRVVPSFNDDIQGTGAVSLAGLMAACRLRGEPLADQRIVIHGGGAAGMGVAWALREGLRREGLSREEASERIFVLDSHGLITDDRALEGYKRPFAHRRTGLAGWSTRPGLLETVRRGRATALIGLSGRPGAFDCDVVRAMAELSPRPVIFPMSNPTSSSEATPADLIEWTAGCAIVATGSPFEPVAWSGRRLSVPQANNAFVFPGLGHGAVLAGAREITDGMVLEAAYALAEYTADRHLAAARVFPPIDELREVSRHVATRVLRQALLEGQTGSPPPHDLESFVREAFWRPEYLPVVRETRPP